MELHQTTRISNTYQGYEKSHKNILYGLDSKIFQRLKTLEKVAGRLTIHPDLKRLHICMESVENGKIRKKFFHLYIKKDIRIKRNRTAIAEIVNDSNNSGVVIITGLRYI